MLAQVMENYDWKYKAEKHATSCLESKPGSKWSVNHPAVLEEKKTPNQLTLRSLRQYPEFPALSERSSASGSSGLVWHSGFHDKILWRAPTNKKVTMRMLF